MKEVFAFDSRLWIILIYVSKLQVSSVNTPEFHQKYIDKIYMKVVLDSFMWKTPSSPEKKNQSPNFSKPHVYLERYMWAKTGKKNMDSVISSDLIPCHTSF